MFWVSRVGSWLLHLDLTVLHYTALSIETPGGDLHGQPPLVRCGSAKNRELSMQERVEGDCKERGCSVPDFVRGKVRIRNFRPGPLGCRDSPVLLLL